LGTPGTVTIQGPVTLAANTTTTLNFSGANNTGDLLDVVNGGLTLAGTLNLISTDNPPQKATQPIEFFFAEGTNPTITGSFTSIRDNVNNNLDSGQIFTFQNGEAFEVTFTP
jgi:hypothetical protein